MTNEIGKQKLLRLTNPLNPEWKCGGCKYWMEKHAAKVAVVITPQGLQHVPQAELARQGGLDKADHFTTIAACFHSPLMQQKRDDDFCAQYVPRMSQ